MYRSALLPPLGLPQSEISAVERLSAQSSTLSRSLPPLSHAALHDVNVLVSSATCDFFFCELPTAKKWEA